MTAATRRGLLLAFLGVLAFSLTLPVTKVALRGYDPITITVGRAAIAGLLAGSVLVAARAARPTRTQVRTLLVAGVGIVWGWPLLSTLALRDITAVQAAVIAAALPLTTAVLGVVRAGERPPAVFWAAAVAGTVAVAAFAVTRGGGLSTQLIPDLLMVGAVVTAAFGYVEGARLTHEIGGWQTISWILVLFLPVNLVVTAWSMSTLRPPGSPGLDATAALLYLAVFSMFLGFLGWYRGLAMLGVARGSQVQHLQPLLSFGWAVLLLGEQVSPGTLMAALVVIAAVVLAQRTRAPASGS